MDVRGGRFAPICPAPKVRSPVLPRESDSPRWSSNSIVTKPATPRQLRTERSACDHSRCQDTRRCRHACGKVPPIVRRDEGDPRCADSADTFFQQLAGCNDLRRERGSGGRDSDICVLEHVAAERAPAL